MTTTHNGVLIPAEMAGASAEDLNAYAERVKAGNGAFVAAYFALEDEAARIGLTMDELDT